MDSKIITITIVDQNKPRQIKCLKVLSKEHYQKIKDKISLLKEGNSIVYSAKIFDQNNIGDNDILFLSKTKEVVKEIKDAKYVVESKKKIITAVTVPVISVNENDEKAVNKLIEAARIKNKKEFPKRVKVMESLINKKIKDVPTPKTPEETSDDKIDATLLSVLENIKAKTVIKEEKEKADSEERKLKNELMKAKLELINKWLDANNLPSSKSEDS